MSGLAIGQIVWKTSGNVFALADGGTLDDCVSQWVVIGPDAITLPFSENDYRLQGGQVGEAMVFPAAEYFETKEEAIEASIRETVRLLQLCKESLFLSIMTQMAK